MINHFRKFGKYYIGAVLAVAAFIMIPTTIVSTLFVGENDTDYFLSDKATLNYQKYANATNQSYISLKNMNNVDLVKNLDSHINHNSKFDSKTLLNSLDNIGNLGTTEKQKETALNNIVKTVDFKNIPIKKTSENSTLIIDDQTSDTNKNNTDSAIKMIITLNDNYVTQNGNSSLTTTTNNNIAKAVKNEVGSIQLNPNAFMNQLKWTNEQYKGNVTLNSDNPQSISSELNSLINKNEIQNVMSIGGKVSADNFNNKVKIIENIKYNYDLTSKQGTLTFDAILYSKYTFSGSKNECIKTFTQKLDGSPAKTINDNIVKLNENSVLSELQQTDWINVNKTDVTNFVKDFNNKDLPSKASIVSSDIPLFIEAVKSYNIVLNDNKTITETIGLNFNYIFDNKTANKTFTIDVPYQSGVQPVIVDKSTLLLNTQNILNNIGKSDWTNVGLDDVNIFVKDFNNKTIADQAQVVMGGSVTTFIKEVKSYQLTLDTTNKQVIAKVNLNDGFVFNDQTSSITLKGVSVPYKDGIPPTPKQKVDASTMIMSANAFLKYINKSSWNDVDQTLITSKVADFNGLGIPDKAKAIDPMNFIALMNEINTYNITLNTTDKTITVKVSLNSKFEFKDDGSSSKTLVPVKVPYKDSTPVVVSIKTSDVKIDDTKAKAYYEEITGEPLWSWTKVRADTVFNSAKTNNDWYKLVKTNLTKAQFNSMVESIEFKYVQTFNPIKIGFTTTLSGSNTFSDTKQKTYTDVETFSS